MLRAGSARCRFLSPVSVSLWAWPAVPLVALWPSPLTWFPAASGSTPGPVGISKLYLQRECVSFLGLALSVPAVCLCGVPTLSPAAAAPGLPVLSYSPPLVMHALVSRVVGVVPSPPCPSPYSPNTPSPSVATPGVLSPWGKYVTPGVSMPCSDLTPPCTPWQSPSGFSATL